MAALKNVNMQQTNKKIQQQKEKYLDSKHKP